MIDEIGTLLDAHWKWLKDKTVIRDLGDEWVEITTPYLDRHNDMLQIYAKRSGKKGFILSDDGYVIGDLLHSGCKLESPKRQMLLKMTLGGFGVSNNEGRLEVNSTAEEFALKKHSLLQAMLAVNDLFFLSVPMVTSLFYEDVTAWLDHHDVRYTPNVKFTGTSGFDHLFEFVIPKSRQKPERILQTINRPSRENAEAFAFKWFDTKEARSAVSLAYAVLNDQELSIQPAVLKALENYGIVPVAWSDRGNIVNELAA
jgi:hypothetical protein